MQMGERRAARVVPLRSGRHNVGVLLQAHFDRIRIEPVIGKKQAHTVRTRELNAGIDSVRKAVALAFDDDEPAGMAPFCRRQNRAIGGRRLT